jgi:Flp pilus assembly protein TadG
MHRIVRRSRPTRSEPPLHQNQRKSVCHLTSAVAGVSRNIDLSDGIASAMISSEKSRCGTDQGAAAVEASITLSVLLLLIVGSIEFGRAMWTYNTMLLAVEEAGRYAMVYNQGPPVTCGSQTQAARCPTLSNTSLANCSAARAQQILSAYQAPTINVSVTEETTSSPATITICASYSFDFVAPHLLPYGALNLTRQITVPLI